MHEADVSTTRTDPTLGLRSRWTRAFLLGELVGFIPPAVVGTTLGSAGASDAAMVTGLTLAGSLEGAAIGYAQSRVLARYVPALDGRAWIRATAVAAAFAWFVGMSGPALFSAEVLPVGLVLAIMIPAWTCGLLAMGYLQWRVLRTCIPGSARWVPVTAGAWLIGVMIPVAALSVVPNGSAPWVMVTVAIIAAVAMGVAVGALTGGTLAGLVRRDVRAGTLTT